MRTHTRHLFVGTYRKANFRDHSQVALEENSIGDHIQEIPAIHFLPRLAHVRELQMPFWQLKQTRFQSEKPNKKR